jgi:UDP-GlcNAc:undecaprenyl-phosphate GlcNAc-1-phosphate transferase
MFIAMALIPIFRSAALRLHAGLDIPNARKVHSRPIPKVGGIAMAISALVPVFFVVNGERLVNAILIGSAVIVLFGLLDDFRQLGWKNKFIGQIIAALVVIYYGGLQIRHLGVLLPSGVVIPDIFSVPITVLTIVGVTNAINLSDGLDGLAGGISLLIFISIGFLVYNGADFLERYFVLSVCAAMIGAIFGFLRFNTYPATVFMGDTGSQLLGFLAITLSLGITQRSTPLSPLLPLLLLGFPVLDVLTVMVGRILSGRSPFRPDKNHFHHKLLRLGLFHAEAVVVIYVITAVLGVAAYILRFDSEWLLLCLYVGFSVTAIISLSLAEKRGYRFHRTGFFDTHIKARLKVFKHKWPLIRICFPPIKFGLPMLFIVSGLMPKQIPFWAQIIAAIFGLGILLVWAIKKEWLGVALRTGFYLLAPIVIYLGQFEQAAWVDVIFIRGYNLSFGVLAFCMVATLKLTRRQGGFSATPTDFLVVALAVIVPHLTSIEGSKNVTMMVMTVKAIVFFFGCDILLGELRGKNIKLATMMLAGLIVLAVRNGL